MATPTKSKVSAADVRGWAATRGLAIAGARGRLSTEAIAQYNAAHPRNKYTGAAK